MSRLFHHVLPGLLAAFAAVAGGTVESFSFKTAETAPVYVVTPAQKPYEQAFRTGLKTLPEGMLAVGAMSLGGGQKLTPEQQGELTPLVVDIYSKIAADPAMAGVPSALPYCFASTRQTAGHCFLYRPDPLPADPTVIVFLHGYGGNLQFYTWLLKEAFPDAVILAPSWGVSWYSGKATYLQDALGEAERRVDVKLGKPWLMAISAGGPGGFRLCGELPEAFRGYVCLASQPAPATIPRLPPNLPMLMLNGTRDAGFPIDRVRESIAQLRRRVPSLQAKELDASHFFLLSHRQQTFTAIREFMAPE